MLPMGETKKTLRMVRLNKIYTKGGDKGLTSLGNGQRVAKHHPRVAAYGDKDELESVLGLLVAHLPPGEAEVKALLLRVQNDLFDLGADLCVPQENGPEGALRVSEKQVLDLESAIDRYNGALAPLESFILRGGTVAAGWAHLACTVCRRAERSAVALAEEEKVNPFAIIYLNRLSDLLFVLARHLNDGGRADVLWQPGQNR